LKYHIASGQPSGRLSVFRTSASTWHSSLTITIANMSQSDFIQQLKSGLNIGTIINSVFSATDRCTAYRKNGLGTLWGYAIAQVSLDSEILDYYQMTKKKMNDALKVSRAFHMAF